MGWTTGTTSTSQAKQTRCTVAALLVLARGVLIQDGVATWACRTIKQKLALIERRLAYQDSLVSRFPISPLTHEAPWPMVWWSLDSALGALKGGFVSFETPRG